MTLFRKAIAVSILLAGCIGMGNALAVPILSFNNSGADINQTYDVGDQFSLDLWISGLQTDNLGAFSLDINFDGAVTDFIDGSYDSSLTDLIASPITDGTSSIQLAGGFLSFDLSGQPDAFRIATLNFSAISVGTSLIDMSNILLSDEFGTSLLGYENYFAGITVVDAGPPVNVSEPSSLVLLASGLFLLMGARKRC